MVVSWTSVSVEVVASVGTGSESEAPECLVSVILADAGTASQ